MIRSSGPELSGRSSRSATGKRHVLLHRIQASARRHGSEIERVPVQTGAKPTRTLGKHGGLPWRSVMSEYQIEDSGGIEMLTAACQQLDRAELLREQIDRDERAIFHSGDMKVVERWSMLNENTIHYEAETMDPATFTKPWKMSMLTNRRLGEDARLQQFKCVEFVEELCMATLRRSP